ncbi:MAG: hypothetical protein Q9172_005397 [Xanthocarpia lactea]
MVIPNAVINNALAALSTSDESLPRIGVVPDGPAGPLTETIPLYALDTDGKPSLLKNTVSGEGFALAMRVLPRMVYFNLCTRLQQEMSLMLETKTTDNTQVERVGSLLNQYGKIRL